MYVKNGEVVQGRAHRYSWEMHVGDIPAGLCVLHRCDTPACVRPDHLFLGTKADNNADMDHKGRRVRGGSLCGLGEYKRGVTHHAAKLNEDTVREIRALRAAGASLSELAAKFEINQSAVWKATAGKSWRHVT